MSKVAINRESIEKALSEHKPTSLSSLYKTITAKKTSVPGSVAKTMRELVPNLVERLSKNKVAVPSTGKRIQGKKTLTKTVLKPGIPCHKQNPFRPGSGYGLLVDIIAAAGPKGIGKEDLQKEYAKYSGKDLTHTRYDMAVINSASKDCDRRHRSCRDGFTILKEGDNFRIRFD